MNRKWLLFAPAALLVVSGCGRRAITPEEAEAAHITWMVTAGVGDAAKQESGIFAPEVKMSQQEVARFGEYQYKAPAPPKIQGDNATIKVQVFKGGTMAGEQEWTFVKHKGAWHIKSAPLP